MRKKILFLSNRGLLPVVDGHTRRSSSILRGLSVNNDIYLLFMYESGEEIEVRAEDLEIVFESH